MGSLLLVDEEGVTLRRKNDRFVVTDKALELLSVPCVDVDCIVLAGNQEFTRAAIDLALSRDISVFLLSKTGKLQGSLLPPMPSGAALRARQYETFRESDTKLVLARALLDAQLRNQRALLRRLALGRSKTETLLSSRQQIKTLLRKIDSLKSPEEIRGTEGHATRLTLEGIRSILDPSLGFSARLVRTDSDPFNCVLDALGGLLAATCFGAVQAARLDVFQGIIHGSSRQAPALALDLEDAYRPLLVLAVAVTLFTKNILGKDDFVLSRKKCHLTARGFSVVCRVLGRRLRSEVTREGSKEPRSYLHHIYEDARRIADWIEEPSSVPVFLTVK
jgi:CRISPR-associated protein Cas1